AASHGTGFRVWEATTGKQLYHIRDLERCPSCLVFSPDGQTVASADRLSLAPCLTDLKSGKHRPLSGGRDQMGLPNLAFSPDGKVLASGDTQGIVRLWDVKTCKERHLPGEAVEVLLARASRDGKLTATLGGDHTLRLWHTATGRLIRQVGEKGTCKS